MSAASSGSGARMASLPKLWVVPIPIKRISVIWLPTILGWGTMKVNGATGVEAPNRIWKRYTDQ
jgi:hypothetical protein